MKRFLYLKFILTYLVLAVISFVFVATAGSYMIERSLISTKSREILAEAQKIASTDMSTYFSTEASMDEFHKSLSAVAAYTGGDICIINNRGEYLIDTASGSAIPDEPAIEGFDPAAFGPGYYEVGTFYGRYNAKMLNVLTPIISKMTTRGYVSIHIPLTDIYARRQSLVNLMFGITGVIFLFSFIILLQFHLSVYRPLRRITEGAHEFSIGNLNHTISVKSSDEMGYLAQSMNLMAREIEKSNDYQKSFISNVSHDFRSPLTSIKGFTDAMIDGTIPPEMHEKYLNIISGEVDRLEGLTQNITKLSNMDPDELLLNRTVFDINRIIKNTAALFEGSCRKKSITINLVLTGDTLEVNADEERIKQVLYNLLDNAIKFSGKKSQIKIETSERYEKCYVSVKDYGTGIKKEDLPKIWDRFYKSDASRGLDQKGTGLGLAIVKEIIKAHGQNINVVSTEGVGTEFIFTLPIA